MKNFLLIAMIFVMFTACGAAGNESLADNFVDILFSMPTFLFGIPIITTFIISKVSIAGNRLQLFTWSIGISLALLSKYLGVGMFEGMTLLETVINGFVVALAANGMADIGFIQWILERLGVKRKMKK